MVRDADFVVVLDAGVIVESGTVAELVAAGGWFAHFAAAAVDTSTPATVEEGDDAESKADQTGDEDEGQEEAADDAE